MTGFDHVMKVMVPKTRFMTSNDLWWPSDYFSRKVDLKSVILIYKFPILRRICNLTQNYLKFDTRPKIFNSIFFFWFSTDHFELYFSWIGPTCNFWLNIWEKAWAGLKSRRWLIGQKMPFIKASRVTYQFEVSHSEFVSTNAF